nr:hypothetical protein [Eubacterium sp.]
MLLNSNKALAGVSMLSALSVIVLMSGAYFFTNTFFFTALAAYLVGYSVNKYNLKYGSMQLVVCTILDAFLNPDKVNWMLYLALGSYLIICEWIFRKWNRIVDIRKKMRRQLVYNCIVFNVMYIPVIVLFQEILMGEKAKEVLPENATLCVVILWVLGQVGWLIYDKAYRVFFQTLQRRKL